MKFQRRVVLLVLITTAVLACVPRLLRITRANVAHIALNRDWIEGLSNGGYIPCEYASNRPTSLKQLEDLSSRIPLRSDELGRLLWLNGYCSEAVKLWTKALDSLPEENSSVVGLLMAGNTEAVPLQMRASLTEYTYWTGMNARAHDNLAASARWYGLSLNLSPQRKTAVELARLYHEQGYFDSERDTWRYAIKNSSEKMPDHWWAIGKLDELDNHWQMAAQAYQMGANLARDPFEYWMRSGDMSEKLEAWQDAEKAYQHALTAAPENSRPYFALGSLNEQQLKYDQAISWYMKALTITPKSIDALYGLGHAYYLVGNDLLAQSYLKTALEVSPSYTWTAYYLAQSLYRSGSKMEAVEYLSKAIDWYPGQPWEWAMQLGDWKQKTNDCQGAKDAYQRALSLGADPNLIDAQLNSLVPACPY